MALLNMIQQDRLAPGVNGTASRTLGLDEGDETEQPSISMITASWNG